MPRPAEKYYTVEEAINYVLLPDGNCSDIEDYVSDDEQEPYQINEGDAEAPTLDETDTHSVVVSEAEAELEEASSALEDYSAPTFKWIKGGLDTQNCQYDGTFSDPPTKEFTPLEYFRMFLGDNCIDNISMQTNLYALQKDGKEINTNDKEIEQFIGILLISSLFKCPSYRMYWAMSTRFPLVADIMSRNRFECILQYFHMNDNSIMPGHGSQEYDPLYKVRPLLDSLRANMLKVDPEECHSVDEQMIPFKGRSSLKQYLKNKPHKWGYKVFTRAGVSGFVYDFKIYTGKNMKLKGNLGVSGNIVFELVKALEPGKNFKIFFDNWFASVPLVHALRGIGLWAIGTIRPNRMKGCPLEGDKDLLEKGRGSYDQKVDSNKEITLVKWFDNKSVHFISSFCGVEPIGNCRRWSKSEKQHVDVPCPFIVQQYNKHMGGVDLADMLIELYRTDIRSKKWYMRIVYYCLDIAVIDAWLLYRRHMTQHKTKTFMPLRDFRASIANGLLRAGKVKGKRGRPSSHCAEKSPPISKRVLASPPSMDAQYDQLGHWPVHTEKKMRCKLCSNGYSRFKCSKCDVYLCLNQRNNCFTSFHVK